MIEGWRLHLGETYIQIKILDHFIIFDSKWHQISYIKMWYEIMYVYIKSRV
jgi:hypothetical protein